MIEDYDYEENAVTGTIYICEDYAKKLYLQNELDEPPRNYDEYGMLIYENLEAEAFSWMKEVVHIEHLPTPQPIVPSKYFDTAERMLNTNQFLPSFYRSGDNHSITVKIIDKETEEQWKEEGDPKTHKMCFRMDSAVSGLFLSKLLAVSALIFAMF